MNTIIIPPQHDDDIELRFVKTNDSAETIEELRARGVEVQQADSGIYFGLAAGKLVIPIQKKRTEIT